MAEIETPIPFAVIGEKGAVWHERLRPLLEPAENDRYIAIDIETGDYAVARSTAEAMRAMYKRRPDASFYLRRIGSTPEPKLARRLFDMSGEGSP